ncbi:MAG: hypothetical protein MK085_04155 [Phycisphaerales bacterium]|nr:hypothetical protein [Phycisphaerales bacterium]
MDELRTLLRIASRRLALSRVLSATAVATIVALGGMLAWVALSKGLPVLVVPWWVGLVVLGVALGIAAIVALARPGRDDVSVAVAIDQRLGLKERFATAVQVTHRDDPFAVAAVIDATSAAGHADTRGKVRQAFRPDAPRGWWLTPLLLVMLVFTWVFVPQGNLLQADQENQVELVKAQDESQAQVDAVIESIEDNPMLAEELAEAMDGMRDGLEGFDGNDPARSPEDIRRETIRKVTALQEKLDEMLEGDEARMENALKRNLEGLKSDPGGDPDAKRMSEALQKGDFSEAKKALEDLANKMQDGELDAEKQEQIKKQLEDLAKQLQEMADQKKALEDELRKAGLDPELAQNPQALEQALENNQNLNQEQKQQLKQMAQAQQAASQACKGMGQACQNMAQGMGQQGKAGSSDEQAQQGAQQMQDMLSDMEAIQQMLQQAKAASGQCKGACEGLGQGLSQWAAALPNQQKKQGQGMGQWGQGAGGNAPISPTPTGTNEVREKVEVRNGDIIARQIIDGEQVVGEAKVGLQRISEKIGRGFEEGVTDDPVPPHLREVHRRYFGEVKKRIDAKIGEKDSAGSSSGTSAEETPGAGTAEPDSNEG